MTSGRLACLHRFPVKSMQGEPVGEFAWDERGGAGDRSHALLDFHKGSWRRLTARQAPAMLGWQARYTQHRPALADPPPPLLRAPDGEELSWQDPRLPVRLADSLGRPVRLHRDPRGQQDLECSLLVTLESTRAALSTELGRELDLLRFRPNLHIELDCPPFAETGWEGRRLRVGDAMLELLHPCVRCVIPTREPHGAPDRWPELLRHLDARHARLFGVNARAIGPGSARAGDSVELL